jgi:xylulokinase
MRASIGLDVGTTSVKGVALSEDGEVLRVAEEGFPLSTPRPGWAEQDPELWWRATEDVLAALDVPEPSGIGIAGQMHGLVALDEDDRVLRPAILWNDQRTALQAGEIEARVGLERLIDLTGNRALTGFTAPKLLWMRDEEPELFGRIESVLLPKDYVRMRLTGEKVTDVADASGTLLFDVAERRWSEQVLEALELPGAWLPPALESQEVSGRTAAGVPVAAGAGDQAAGALGVGVTHAGGPLSIEIGTSGVVFAALPDFRTEPEARVHTFCHATPSTWHAMGVMLSAAGSLRWLRDLIGQVTYAELTDAAAAWPAGAEGLWFQPYLAGERTPHADAHARGSFTGLTLRHDRGALARAVLEGVAFGLRDSFDLVGDLGVEASRARVSGGGARSQTWLQIVASVLALPLERTAVDEGAAYGAALLGGVVGGFWADAQEAADACVRVSSVVEPDPELVDVYEDMLPHYRELYPVLH